MMSMSMPIFGRDNVIYQYLYQVAIKMSMSISMPTLLNVSHSPGTPLELFSTADLEKLSNRKRANHQASRTTAPLLHSGYSLATTPAGHRNLKITKLDNV